MLDSNQGAHLGEERQVEPDYKPFYSEVTQ